MGHGWVPAYATLGEDVATLGGTVLHVEVVRLLPELHRVYNFEVDSTHSYFVGNGGAWVHNASKGTRPPNLSPRGAGRRGAFKAAKRDNNIPTSQQPSATRPNVDRRGNPQPGKQYDFRDSKGNEVTIRDDSGGHDFGPGDPQNRGPHFNDPAGNHYDY